MPRIKKEGMEVKVKRLGGLVFTVALNGEHSVADALKACEMNCKETESIRVNGKEASKTTELKDGDTVSLVKKVAGGQY